MDSTGVDPIEMGVSEGTSGVSAADDGAALESTDDGAMMMVEPIVAMAAK